MNTELNNLLQNCIDSCDRLARKSDEEDEKIHEAMSGELMEAYLQGLAKSREKLKTLRDDLSELQIEAQYGM
ncbi:MAG: hypothetical protein IKG97_01045 [Lachnospiraceae bacterium]|nr:hypothetical protein [Lachnospiraceae bacterium]